MKSVRQEFPRYVKEALWLRADGRCEACHQPFAGRRPHYDHYPVPAALDGPGTVENGRCICVTCHRLATSETDVPRISKAKRLERDRAGISPRHSAFRERADYFRRRAEKIDMERDT